MNVVFEANDGHLVDVELRKDGEPMIVCLVSSDKGRTWSHQLSDNYTEEIKLNARRQREHRDALKHP